MQINTTTLIRDVFGNTIPMSNHADKLVQLLREKRSPEEIVAAMQNDVLDEEVYTIASAVIMAMIAPDQADTPEQKYACYTIANLMQRNATVELSHKQRDLIIKKVGKHFGPVIVGPIFDLLDPKEQEDGDSVST